jgi:hypothetical protein
MWKPYLETSRTTRHFKRFHLRGFKKVEIEFALLAIAYNLAKVAS